MKNWKTTVAGVGLLLVAVGQVLNAVATGDYGSIDLETLMASLAGVGLVVAGDTK